MKTEWQIAWTGSEVSIALLSGLCLTQYKAAQDSVSALYVIVTFLIAVFQLYH